MSNQRELWLYGLQDARDKAVRMLESQATVQCITLDHRCRFILDIDDALNETSLIPLLMQCGISGFRLV